ncbi:MAG: hypothetical protein NXH88_10005 [Hyphomonas sp.]|nr:hypothetical protein [Hyphomonas sp.]
MPDKPGNKIGENNGPRPGRPKGSPNKTTALLKDAILQAAEKAGDKDGMVGYLKKQADKNPTAFMGLLGKVLPMQVQGSGENGEFETVTRIELVAPSGSNSSD